MKKVLLSIIAVILSALVLLVAKYNTGFNYAKLSEDTYERGSTYFTYDYIGIITTKCITLNITNNSFEAVTVNNDFYLEVGNDSKWYYLPSRGSTSAYQEKTIEPGETAVISFFVKDKYGRLPKGEYRIITNEGVAVLFDIINGHPSVHTPDYKEPFTISNGIEFLYFLLFFL